MSNRYGLREILDCTFRDFATKKPFLYMDYATATENVWEGNQVFARGGRGNPKRIGFFDEKDSTLTISTQVFSLKMLAMLTGKDIETATQNVYKREELTAETSGMDVIVTLAQTPVNTDDVVAFTLVNEVDDTEVTISSVSGETVTVTGVDAGDKIAVYYQFATASTASKVRFTASDFPKYWEITGDTLFADEILSELIPAQLIYYKARPNVNFTLSLAPTGEPTTLEIQFELFATRVDGEDVMADLILYNEDDIS